MKMEFSNPHNSPQPTRMQPKTATILNYVISGIWWLLALLTLMCNMLGLWAAWHLVGFSWLAFAPLSALFQIIGLYTAIRDKEQGYLKQNLIILGISILLALLEVFVFCTWW